jgi:hypothetical protein
MQRRATKKQGAGHVLWSMIIILVGRGFWGDHVAFFNAEVIF